MKILHVVPTYLPAYRYGGPIQSVHALNKWLVRAHAEVTVYTTAIDGPGNLDVPMDQPVELDGVQVNYFAPGHPRSWFYSPSMARALKGQAGDFDIIHITSVFLAASTLGARAARSAGVPYLISPRGSLMAAPLSKKSPFKKRLYMDALERDNLEGADALHFTTEQERIEYEKLGYRLKRSVVIPNGLDPESLPSGDPDAFRKKFGISKDSKVVLFLGRLSWKKGLDTLLPAFARTAKTAPEALLVLAGGDDEGYRPALEKMAASLRIKDRTLFTGEILGGERTGAYRAADVFVLPSYSENFAGTVAEAMYFGLPVIVSDQVGLASAVREAAAGLAVPKDEEAFSAAMVSILKDPAAARAMGEKGISLVANKFSYGKIAQTFLGAYNEIIASHPQ